VNQCMFIPFGSLTVPSNTSPPDCRLPPSLGAASQGCLSAPPSRPTSASTTPPPSDTVVAAVPTVPTVPAAAAAARTTSPSNSQASASLLIDRLRAAGGSRRPEFAPNLDALVRPRIRQQPSGTTVAEDPDSSALSTVDAADAASGPAGSERASSARLTTVEASGTAGIDSNDNTVAATTSAAPTAGERHDSSGTGANAAKRSNAQTDSNATGSTQQAPTAFARGASTGVDAMYSPCQITESKEATTAAERPSGTRTVAEGAATSGAAAPATCGEGSLGNNAAVTTTTASKAGTDVSPSGTAAHATGADPAGAGAGCSSAFSAGSKAPTAVETERGGSHSNGMPCLVGGMTSTYGHALAGRSPDAVHGLPVDKSDAGADPGTGTASDLTDGRAPTDGAGADAASGLTEGKALAAGNTGSGAGADLGRTSSGVAGGKAALAGNMGMGTSTPSSTTNPTTESNQGDADSGQTGATITTTKRSGTEQGTAGAGTAATSSATSASPTSSAGTLPPDNAVAAGAPNGTGGRAGSAALRARANQPASTSRLPPVDAAPGAAIQLASLNPLSSDTNAPLALVLPTIMPAQPAPAPAAPGAPAGRAAASTPPSKPPLPTRNAHSSVPPSPAGSSATDEEANAADAAAARRDARAASAARRMQARSRSRARLDAEARHMPALWIPVYAHIMNGDVRALGVQWGILPDECPRAATWEGLVQKLKYELRKEEYKAKVGWVTRSGLLRAPPDRARPVSAYASSWVIFRSQSSLALCSPSSISSSYRPLPLRGACWCHLPLYAQGEGAKEHMCHGHTREHHPHTRFALGVIRVVSFFRTCLPPPSRLPPRPPCPSVHISPPSPAAPLERAELDAANVPVAPAQPRRGRHALPREGS